MTYEKAVLTGVPENQPQPISFVITNSFDISNCVIHAPVSRAWMFLYVLALSQPPSPNRFWYVYCTHTRTHALGPI